MENEIFINRIKQNEYTYDPKTGSIVFTNPPKPELRRRKWWQFWKPKYYPVITVEYRK